MLNIDNLKNYNFSYFQLSMIPKFVHHLLQMYNFSGVVTAEEAVGDAEAGGIWEISVPPTRFCCEPKHFS